MTDLDTHHDFCWQSHHACAQRRVERLEDALRTIRDVGARDVNGEAIDVFTLKRIAREALTRDGGTVDDG